MGNRDLTNNKDRDADEIGLLWILDAEVLFPGAACYRVEYLETCKAAPLQIWTGDVVLIPPNPVDAPRRDR